MNKMLLSFCRYYKCEKENPYKDSRAVFWDLEKIWYDESSKDEESVLLLNNTAEYINANLIHWNETDQTPYLLKALLFNRYRQWLGGYGLEEDTRAFKEWYQKNYIGQS